MVKITVPATSANLGPGFDSLGIAVTWYNEIWLEEDDGLKIESLDEIMPPLDESNLIYQTVRSLFERCGKPFSGVHIKQTNRIPMARGLGSSSACIVGGLLGANHLMGGPLTREDLLNIAASLEGHPDNVAPAILGGLVTAVLEDGKVFHTKQDLPKDLRFVAIVPDFELKTSVARAALPKTVDHHDAVYNLSRAALMATSLMAGKYENLKVATEDRLHQPYRLSLIPGAEEVIRFCETQGAYGSYISGAGSTLMSMIPAEDPAFVPSLRKMLDETGRNQWKLLSLDGDNRGAFLQEES